MAKKFRWSKRNISLVVSAVVAVAGLGQQLGWWGGLPISSLTSSAIDGREPITSLDASQTVTKADVKGTQTTRAQQPPVLEPNSYRVDSVVDGDTIRIVADGANGGYKTAGGTETVRLIGVDTPETQAPGKPVQCFGREASDYLKQLLIDAAGAGAVVKLAPDPLNDDRDRYRRLLRYVYLPDNRLVQSELLTNGYAFAYTKFPFSQSDAFVSQQSAAQTALRGLWGACKPTANSSGQYASNPVN